MVTKKAYELLEFKVIQWNCQDVLTASDDTNDQFFIKDGVDWSQVK